MSSPLASEHTLRVLTPVKITHRITTTDLRALIDSGADESLTDWGLAAKLRLNSEPLARPIEASALNGTELFNITHTIETVKLHTHGHKELINFYLFQSPSQALILGHPWLHKHNHHFNWKSRTIIGYHSQVIFTQR